MTNEFKYQCNLLREIIGSVEPRNNPLEGIAEESVLLDFDYGSVGIYTNTVPCFNTDLEFREVTISDFITCMDSYILSGNQEEDSERKNRVKANYLLMVNKR